MDNNAIKIENLYSVIENIVNSFKNQNAEILDFEKYDHDFVFLYKFVEKMFEDLIKSEKCNSKLLNDSSVYFGQIKDDMPNGCGKSVLLKNGKQKYKYIGFWENGQKCKFGLTITDLDITLGECNSHNKNGYNIVKYKSDNLDNFLLVRGNFIDNKLEHQSLVIYKNKSIYLGNINHSKRCGDGILIGSDEKYTQISGQWKNNYLYGLATFTKRNCQVKSFCLPNTDPYFIAYTLCNTGVFFCHTNPYDIKLCNNSQYNGECRLLTDRVVFNYYDYYKCVCFPNRLNISIGKNKKFTWEKKPGNIEFLPHGLGTYNDVTCRYRGYFMNGKYNGYGFLKYKQGDISYYHGGFKDNMRHGNGTILFSYNLPRLSTATLTDDCAILKTPQFKAVFTNNSNFYFNNCYTFVRPSTQKYAYIQSFNDKVIRVYGYIDVDNFICDKTLSINENDEIICNI